MTLTLSSYELDHLLDLAVSFARQAGEVHLQRDTGDIDTKSTATDPVSEVDRKAETLIVCSLSALFVF